MQLLDALKWRYATKRMNGKKLDQAKVDTIVEAIRLTPSSMGLQPYQVIVVENDELKKRIQPVAFNQPQITEASHLLIFAAWDDITEERFDAFIQEVAEQRDVPVDSLGAYANYKKMIVGRPTEVNHQWAARQAYIAFGTGIVAAAVENVDATPMEGFDPAALDDLLGLKEKGLRSVTILALGHRDEANDWLLPLKKVRRPKEDFIALAE